MMGLLPICRTACSKRLCSCIPFAIRVLSSLVFMGLEVTLASQNIIFDRFVADTDLFVIVSLCDLDVGYGSQLPYNSANIFSAFSKPRITFLGHYSEFGFKLMS